MSKQGCSPEVTKLYAEIDADIEARAKEEAEAARRARRDMFAAAALQGLLASRGPGMDLRLSDPLNAASWAVAHADALIAELDKPMGPS